MSVDNPRSRYHKFAQSHPRIDESTAGEEETAHRVRVKGKAVNLHKITSANNLIPTGGQFLMSERGSIK